MKKVTNKLRVVHFAQVPCKPFIVEVADEYEAKKIYDVLAHQHLFLLKQNIIPDYSNAIIVEMYDSDSDGKGTPGWITYWNEAELMDWEEIEIMYLKESTNFLKMPNNNNLLILLRCLSAEHETVLETPDGIYYSSEFKGTSLVPEGSEERTIESRIQFELYGEYPLSEKDQHDWDSRVKKAFHRYLTY